MQRFPPALDGLYSFSLACPSWLWQYKPEGIWKKAFREIIFVVLMHNSVALLFNLCRPVWQLHFLRRRPTHSVQTARRYTLLTFLIVSAAIILQRCGVTHYYSVVKVLVLVLRREEINLRRKTDCNVVIFWLSCRWNTPCVRPQEKEHILCFPHAVEAVKTVIHYVTMYSQSSENYITSTNSEELPHIPCLCAHFF